MEEQKDKVYYLQCQSCGKIFTTDFNLSNEDAMVHMCCPRCAYQVALNLGNNIESIYEFYNPNVDDRI